MVKDQLKMLIKLQQKDVFKEKLDCRLKDILDKRDINALGESIASQDSSLKAKHENIKSISREVKSFELKLNELDETQRQLEKRIYSGEVNTVKELNQLQQKQEKIKQNAENIEDTALNLMVEMEDLKKTFSLENAELRQRKQEYQQKKLKNKEEVDRINKEISNVQLEIKELLNLIPQPLLDKYYKIKKQKKAPVALVSEGKCNGCRMQISIMLVKEVEQGKQLVYCENCGRILVSI